MVGSNLSSLFKGSKPIFLMNWLYFCSGMIFLIFLYKSINIWVNFAFCEKFVLIIFNSFLYISSSSSSDFFLLWNNNFSSFIFWLIISFSRISFFNSFSLFLYISKYSLSNEFNLPSCSNDFFLLENKLWMIFSGSSFGNWWINSWNKGISFLKGSNFICNLSISIFFADSLLWRICISLFIFDNFNSSISFSWIILSYEFWIFNISSKFLSKFTKAFLLTSFIISLNSSLSFNLDFFLEISIYVVLATVLASNIISTFLFFLFWYSLDLIFSPIFNASNMSSLGLILLVLNSFSKFIFFSKLEIWLNKFLFIIFVIALSILFLFDKILNAELCLLYLMSIYF